MEANNKLHFLPIWLCFINVYTYPNPKPTPYNNAKTAIIVVGLQCDKIKNTGLFQPNFGSNTD